MDKLNKKEENLRKEQANNENKENDELKLETRTIEDMLKDLREEKGWSYLELMEELRKVGVILDDKTIKKWEYGLIYPDADTVYKLSEIYKISSKRFIEAKNNSYQKGINSIHMTFIKWFSYFTGISMKIAYYGILAIIVFMAFWAIFFISENSKEFVRIWRK